MRKFLGLVLALSLVFGNAAMAEEKPLIGIGDYGKAVVDLHQKLIGLGLLGIRAESPYGPESAEAVGLLQEVIGADLTGIVRDQTELERLIQAEIDLNINLATCTEEPVTVTPAGESSWCSPIELYPTSSLGLALLRNTGRFTVSFDWTATGVDEETNPSISLRFTGPEKTWYAPVGYFNIPIGDNDGHCEVTFEPNADMRLYGTGWLISEIGTANRGMQIVLSNFKLIRSVDGMNE